MRSENSIESEFFRGLLFLELNENFTYSEEGKKDKHHNVAFCFKSAFELDNDLDEMRT